MNATFTREWCVRVAGRAALAGCTDRRKERFRALHLDQPLALDLPEPVADRPHEAAVVGNQQAAHLMGHQFDFERFLPLDVEMVGRFVEQVEVRVESRSNSMPSRAFWPPESRLIGRA